MNESRLRHMAERYRTECPRCAAADEGVMPGGFRACISCEAICYPGDRYCSCCGEPLAGRSFGLGSRVRHPIANYCSDCGTRLHVDTSMYGAILREHQQCSVVRSS